MWRSGPTSGTHRLAGAGQEGLRLWEKRRSGCCEMAALRGALQQTYSKDTLQTLDLTAQVRLSNVQCLSSLGKILALSNDSEIPHQSQIEIKVGIERRGGGFIWHIFTLRVMLLLHTGVRNRSWTPGAEEPLAGWCPEGATLRDENQNRFQKRSVPDMGRYDGRSVVITGGGSGFGLATAQLLVNEGARVLVTGRDQNALDAAQDQLGEDASTIRSDAASLPDID